MIQRSAFWESSSRGTPTGSQAQQMRNETSVPGSEGWTGPVNSILSQIYSVLCMWHNRQFSLHLDATFEARLGGAL